jgi:hypothetical protein
MPNPLPRCGAANIALTLVPILWDCYIAYLAWSLLKKLKEQREVNWVTGDKGGAGCSGRAWQARRSCIGSCRHPITGIRRAYFDASWRITWIRSRRPAGGGVQGASQGQGRTAAGLPPVAAVAFTSLLTTSLCLHLPVASPRTCSTSLLVMPGPVCARPLPTRPALPASPPRACSAASR